MAFDYLRVCRNYYCTCTLVYNFDRHASLYMPLKKIIVLNKKNMSFQTENYNMQTLLMDDYDSNINTAVKLYKKCMPHQISILYARDRIKNNISCGRVIVTFSYKKTKQLSFESRNTAVIILTYIVIIILGIQY